MGGHQLAVVRWYCMQSDDTTFTNNGYLNYVANYGGQNVLEIYSSFILKDRREWKEEERIEIESRKLDSACNR